MTALSREALLDKWNKQIPVLDHGFIRLVDVMGSPTADLAVLEAARTSTAAESKGAEADRNLIRYLMRNKHATPFEACNIKLHVKLPIFVERQWVRHRASWLNEMSARYQPLPAEYYVPDASRVQLQSTDNRQGSGDAASDLVVSTYLDTMAADQKQGHRHYQAHLEDGISREIARIHLPLGTYTEKIWGTSLRMLLHFLGLRKHPHAQWEIRQYADVIWQIVEDWAPLTAEAFEDYTLGSHTFSRQEMDALRDILEAIPGGPVKPVVRKALASQFNLGSVRERKAFWSALGLL